MTLTAELCTCGHDNKWHPVERDGKRESFPCVYIVNGFSFCKCGNFKNAVLQEESDMAKEKKQRAVRVAKPKGEGRKPTLAPFVDGPFKLYATLRGGKEVEAQVLKSGVIVMNEKEYTSPSAAATKAAGVATDGWRFWKFNKDGERVTLDTLRGKESPLRIVEAKPKAEKKPRAQRKSRVKKESPVEMTESASAA